MKKSLLWLLIMLLTVSMVATFSLAGCKKEEVAEEEAVEEEAVEEEVAEEEAAPTGEQVVLHSMFLGATWGTAAQELAVEYEEETGVKVDVELVGRDQIYTKLALAVAGEANYDIFNIDYSWIPQFASSVQKDAVSRTSRRALAGAVSAEERERRRAA